MARIDDYRTAKKMAAEKLAATPLNDISEQSGFKKMGADSIHVPFLNRGYIVRYPDFSFTDETEPEKEIPLQEQVLILHYLEGCIDDPDTTGPGASRNWIAYREIPGASFYFAAFVKRAIDPLKQVFGQNIDGFNRSADCLGAAAIEPGDAGAEFAVFPRVKIQLIIYAGDDEFPPEANILFEPHIGALLSPEDVAWLAGMVVYRLMALTRG